MAWKWLTVPFSNATVDVEVPQMWEVRWLSRHGKYHSDTLPEIEAFVTEEEAEFFASALRNAFILLRHTDSLDGGTKVSVKRAR